jgi:hypothetical protein
MTDVLWTVQGVLALLVLFAGGMKLMAPLEMMTNQIPLPVAEFKHRRQPSSLSSGTFENGRPPDSNCISRSHKPAFIPVAAR